MSKTQTRDINAAAEAVQAVWRAHDVAENWYNDYFDVKDEETAETLAVKGVVRAILAGDVIGEDTTVSGVLDSLVGCVRYSKSRPCDAVK